MAQQDQSPEDKSERPPPVPPRESLPHRTCLRSGSTPETAVKCGLVGDRGVGDRWKTSLIVSYTTNGYLAEHVPTAFDNFTARVDVDGSPVQLQVCDMARQHRRSFLLPECEVPEVRRVSPVAPVVLVGMQSDLREDVQVLIQLARQRERPVSVDEARLVARSLGVTAFAECSALTQKNLKAVFDTAIVVSLEHKEKMKGLRQRQRLKQIHQ